MEKTGYENRQKIFQDFELLKLREEEINKQRELDKSVKFIYLFIFIKNLKRQFKWKKKD